MMSNEWQGMTPDQKSPFEKQCSDDKERYNREMKAY